MNQRLRLGPFFALSAMTLLILAGGPSAAAQMIVAHRGASDAAPENTLAAFQLAWKLGADAIEGDFYLTTDQQIVTMHDSTTKKTAGVDLKVANCTLKQLKQLEVGSWKSPRFRGERIPTIEEVLAVVPEDKKILIEIKCGPEIVPKLKDVLANSSLAPSQTIVIAFKESVVSAVKKQIPNVKVYWLTSFKEDKKTHVWSPQLDEVLAALKRMGADGLDVQANQKMVDARFIRAVRDAGYEVHTWTIDDPRVARHFQRLGVDSITTNRPRLIRDQLAAPAQ